MNLQKLQAKDMILLFENNVRGGISSVTEKRYSESKQSKRMFYADANNLNGWAMSHEWVSTLWK